MKWIALLKLGGWYATCRILQVSSIYAWCAFDVPPCVCTSIGAWRSPIQHQGDVVDPCQHLGWCGGSLFNILVGCCEPLVSQGSHLMLKNLFGTFLYTSDKYCTHLMSGLGSGMPQGVTMVTPVTVNFWAHVTRPHEWRISVDGEENLGEEKNFSEWECHCVCR